MAVITENNDRDKQSTLTKVDLDKVVKGQGAQVQYDEGADYYERVAPPYPGIYGGKVFEDKDGYSVSADGHFFIGLEIKLKEFISHPDLKDEYTDYTVLGKASTTIPKGKKTSSMATIMAKAGIPVGRLVNAADTARVFSGFLKKEPTIYFQLEWKAWSKEFDNGVGQKPGRVIHYNGDDFPKDANGMPIMDFTYKHKDGHEEKIRAIPYPNAFYGNLADAKSQVGGVKGAKKVAVGMATVTRETVAPQTTQQTQPTPSQAQQTPSQTQTQPNGGIPTFDDTDFLSGLK